MSLVHGLELGGDGKPAWLRFGILQLLYHLYGTKSAEASRKDWLDRLHSQVFRHQVSHFQQCFWNFDRAAGHVARCKEVADRAMGQVSETIGRYQRGEITRLPDPDSDQLVLNEAGYDLMLFLDAMLFYLRIQADTFARLVEYFYKADNMLPGDFAGQSGWFTQRHPEVDPGYTSILRSNREWFDRLTGDNGLRDVVNHESGMLSVGWAKPQDGPIEPRTSLYRSRGVVEENVFEAIKEITAGWFTFLDEAWRHFVPRLTEAGVLVIMSVNEPEKTRFCDKDELRGWWVYPIVGSDAA
jgi:hypothetical protein